MKLLAAQPNVVSKTSALGTFIHRNDRAHIEAITRETVAMFGAERSHVRLELPDREALDHLSELIAAHARRGATARPTNGKLLHDTAMRVYRLA
jgi:predicted TIM-barrel fold metal-dependent hydrolase